VTVNYISFTNDQGERVHVNADQIVALKVVPNARRGVLTVAHAGDFTIVGPEFDELVTELQALFNFDGSQ
jgi:hypothetical protein